MALGIVFRVDQEVEDLPQAVLKSQVSRLQNQNIPPHSEASAGVMFVGEKELTADEKAQHNGGDD